MPRGGECEHPNCQGNKSGCKQLTDEELEPKLEDIELAHQLLSEGWIPVSTNNRIIAKPPPGRKAEDLIKPEMMETREGKFLAAHIRSWQEAWARSYGEQRTLTLRQYRAFRKLFKGNGR